MNSLQAENTKDLSPQHLLDLYNKLKTKNKKRIDAIISTIPDLMFLVDSKGNYLDVFANNKEHLLYKPEVEIIGKNITDFFDPETSEGICTIFIF
jgi:transcriptional regulator with PAS, ATPase and Fis domain